MRWYDITALILIGALSLGAYLFGTEVAADRFLSDEVQPDFDDTHYVAAHRQYMTAIAGVLLGSGLVFGLTLLWGGARLCAFASGVAFLWCAAIVLTIVSQHFLSLRGMPQRNVAEAEDPFFNALSISTMASVVAMIAGAALLLLLVAARIQRLRSRNSGTAPT